MPLPDNAPEKWEYDEHTKVKHELLQKYVYTWISIIGSRHPTMGYVDGFAGRGVYEDGSRGSPLIVMAAAQSQIEKIGKVKTFLCKFIENNEENFKCLEEQIKLQSSEFPNVECESNYGDFNDISTDFLDMLEGKPMIPVLYFIDPFGWSGIPFETIQRILSHRYSEILFVLMTYEIARFASSKFHGESLNILYGGEYWKEALQYTGEKRHQALREIYEDRIREDTDAPYVWSFRINDPEMRKRTKYYIIHATHHMKGLRVMKDIMRGQGAGIFEYLGPEDDAMQGVQRFEVLDLKGFLKDHFKGRRITFDGLCDELYPITGHPISQYVEKDFRKAIQEMEKDDPDIEVIRISSKRTGLKERDIIIFK